MQREARFILPAKFNNGQMLSAQIFNGIVDKLVDEFGGATVAQAYGYWKHPEGEVMAESVYTFDVALPDERAKESAFIAIATHAAIQAEQHSVYIRLPNGEVTIPTVEPLARIQEVA